jgi:K+-sensing histidine kinase KdpD
MHNNSKEKDKIESMEDDHGFGSPLKLFDLDFELTDTRTELVKKIRWLIRVRFVVSAGVVLMMFFTGWQGLTRQQALTRATVLATLITGGVAVALNLVYYIQMRRQRNLRAFVLAQLVVDVLIFSSYVYRSGGVTSPFTFLYLLPIVATAIMVSGRATFGVALFAALCYCGMAVLGALGLVDHVSYFVALDSFARKGSYVTLMLLVNSLGFFVVASLSVFLMRSVRSKTNELTAVNTMLDRKAQLLQMLYRVSRSAVDARDSSDVVDQIGRLLVEGLNLDRVLLYLVSDDGQRLELAREFYHPRLAGRIDRANLQVEIPLEAEAGITARCALARRPENVSRPEEHPLINKELARRIGVNPFAVSPMVVHGQLLGVLGVDRKFELGTIDEDDFKLLIAFADQAAVSLRAAQLELAAAE